MDSGIIKDSDSEFIYLVIDERFYIVHLFSDSLLYVHCTLYDRPEEISEDRFHYPVEIERPEDDKDFKLVLVRTDMPPNIAWILVLKAAAWFKSEGLRTFSLEIPG